MSRVFWDTNLFIYLLEGNPKYIDRMRALRRSHHQRGDTIVTSWMTVAELQVKPIAMGESRLAETYAETLKSTTELVAFDEKASAAFLYIRTKTTIKGPDAIQLACAAAAGVELFITNDDKLTKVVIPGIHYIMHFDQVPL